MHKILMVVTWIALVSNASGAQPEQVPTPQPGHSANATGTDPDHGPPTTPTGVRFLAFVSPDCQACQTMQPLLANMRRFGYRIEHLDVDKFPEAVKQFRVRSIPTLLALLDERELRRMIGVASPAQLGSFVDGARSALRRATANIPAAVKAETLIRATYVLDSDRAQALIAFLEEHIAAPIQTEIVDERLVITAEQDVQESLGRLIALLQAKASPSSAATATAMKASTPP